MAPILRRRPNKIVVVAEYPPHIQNGSTKKRNRAGKKAANKKQAIKQGSESKQKRSAISLTDLPSNVLVEIITRLPLRTLFVARSVCKTLGFLSTPNPHFTNLDSSNAPQILIFQFRDFERISRLLHVADQVPDYENSQLKPLFQLPKMDTNHLWYPDNLSLANSCNELLFFKQDLGDSRSLVCNPVTSEYIIIPDAVDPKMSLYSNTLSLWLGFSPDTDQYKVLRIFRWKNAAGLNEVAAQVFVIGPDSWKDIDASRRDIDWLFWCLCETQNVNGLVYFHYGEFWPGGIITFDFEREKFGEVALPAEFQGEDFFTAKHKTSIGVLGGCLCLSCNSFITHRVDLWVMRKRGNQEYWTKDFVVDTVTLSPRGLPVCGQFKPLQFHGNGEILMLWRTNTLICYDPRTKSLRCFRLHRRGDLGHAVVGLTPSFVPLKDALKVDKVLTRLRPRGDEDEL